MSGDQGKSERPIAKKQGIARIALGIAAIWAFTAPVTADAAEPRYAAILVSQKTGETLYSSNADMPLHPASITKMMTLYLAFEALEQGKLKLTDPVVYSRHATMQRPSRLGIAAGRSLTVDEVIRSIAVKSANDSAVALAEKIDGTEDAFAAHMTRTARMFGMRNTQYVNASGLSNPGQLTSARDIAILANKIIQRFPTRYRYFGTRSFDYASASWLNHNHLLGKVPGVDGIKTGYTVDAGFTLAASADRKGTRLIAVVLGAKSARSRDADVTSLLDLGFDALDRRTHGDTVQVADNFRPGGLGVPVVSSNVEQGSSDPGDRPRHLKRKHDRKIELARATTARSRKKQRTELAARTHHGSHKSEKKLAARKNGKKLAAHSPRKSGKRLASEQREDRHHKKRSA